MASPPAPHFALKRTAALPRSVGRRSRSPVKKNPLELEEEPAQDNASTFALKRSESGDVHGVDSLAGVEAAWKRQQLEREEKWVEIDFEKAKKKYQDAKKHVRHHPHAALRAQRGVAQVRGERKTLTHRHTHISR